MERYQYLKTYCDQVVLGDQAQGYSQQVLSNEEK